MSFYQEWKLRYPGTATTTTLDKIEKDLIREVGFHEARQLLHRRLGLPLSKSVNLLMNQALLDRNIDLKNVTDLETKVKVLNFIILPFQTCMTEVTKRLLLK